MGNLANERYQTGNHALVFTRGDGERQLLGTGRLGRLSEGTSVDINVNTGARPVHVVGSAEPQDIVDGAHTYEGTLALLRFRNRGVADLINAGPIDIDIVDANGGHVQSIEECHLGTGRISIPANSLVIRNLNFQAMRVT